MDFLYYVLLFGVAFCLGWFARGVYLRMVLRYLLKETETPPVAKTIVTLDIVGDSIFVYEKNTGRFLTHGTCFEEVVTNLSKLYPTKNFTTHGEELEKLRELDV